MVARADRRLFAEIDRWCGAFERGEIRSDMAVAPTLMPGERVAVRVGSIGVTRQTIGVPSSDWAARPGSTAPGDCPRASPNATSHRALVVGGHHRVVHQWRWEEVLALSALADGRSSAIQAEPDDDVVDVISSERHGGLFGRPNSATVRLAWLKFEGAFAAFRGHLDGWIRSLPARAATGPGR